MSRTSLWRVLAIALPVLGALVAPLPAVDLAYQLRAGGEILDAGAIPTVDSWTFTVAGTPWLDQQWGAQVLLALVDRLGGWTGLVLLRALLVGVAFGCLALVVRRRGPGLGARTAALLVITAFLVSASALALRPQLFAIDLFALTLAILALRDQRPRVVWLIPLLALAWANLHGTYPLVVVLCGLAWLGDLAEAAPARHRMLLVGLVAAGATAITPFGPAVWTYVANLASNPTIAGRVSEWQPPSPLTVSGAIVWASIVGVAALLLLRIRRDRRVPWPAAITLLVFGAFAAISGRGMAWWPFAAAFVIAPWLAPRPEALASVHLERPTPPLLRRLNAVIVAVLVLAGVVLLPAWRPVGAAGVPEGTASYAPQGIAAGLNRIAGSLSVARELPVWNPQVWGSWLELAAPDFRYALDSRIELFPPAVWADADAVTGGDIEALDTYRVAIVVTDRHVDGGLGDALSATGAWAQLIVCPEGDVWVRTSILPQNVGVTTDCR